MQIGTLLHESSVVPIFYLRVVCRVPAIKQRAYKAVYSLHKAIMMKSMLRSSYVSIILWFLIKKNIILWNSFFLIVELRRKISDTHQTEISLKKVAAPKGLELEREILEAEYAVITDKVTRLQDKVSVFPYSVAKFVMVS